MFRAAQNPFDDVVAKATDENLTSENWEYNLDVCDKVGERGDGAKDAVAAMIKRLAHRNANVQLYTLILANALAENCGVTLHRELASRSFTDALLRLANDRNTHQTVKTDILARMEHWAEMFKHDPDLGIMSQQYQKLKSTNPNIHAPSKPTKNKMTDLERQKEDEELRMAVELSLRDKPAASAQKQSSSGAQQSQPQQAAPVGTTAATVNRVKALYDFQPSEPGELAFRKGDVIAVLESVYKDWWKGSLRGQVGIFPLNYVEKLADPTPAELERDAQMEADVFAQIKNVEKLLTLLSTSSSELNVQENEEITKLYHSTLAIRPKLIELIGKYSQKKDEFTSLNEKFIKARRDYESLLETSLSQPYGRPPAPGNAPYGYPPVAGYAPAPSHDPRQYYGADGHAPPDQGGPGPGKQPFYVVGAPGAPGGPQMGGRMPGQPGPGGRISIHGPQELATSSYDSPTAEHEPSVGYVAPSPVQQHAPPSSSRPYGQGYPPYQQVPSPSNAPPGPPSQSYAPYQDHSQNPSRPSPSPGPAGTNSYPSLSQPQSSQQQLPSQPPSSSQYASYNAVRPSAPGGYGPPSPHNPPGGPADYYRQNTGQNELFLPPGNRAPPQG